MQAWNSIQNMSGAYGMHYFKKKNLAGCTVHALGWRILYVGHTALIRQSKGKG